MRRLLLVFPALWFSSACGGKVVFVDEDGTGGTTATNGVTGTSGTNGTSGSSGTDATTGSTTTGGFISPCQRLCMDFAHCFADCQAECEALYHPGCETETSEYVLCLAHNFTPTCELGTVCDGEFAVHQNCFAPTIDCVETRCSQASDGCACDGFCDATNLVQACKKNDDFFECSCTAEGVLLGTCVQSDNVCELDLGCCKEVWLLTQE